MSGLFHRPKLPEVQPPTPMPDADSTAAARRRRLATEVTGAGYGSTILTAGGRETLGG